MQVSEPRVIHWFRRDLRIADNSALWHAASHGLAVVPVYILSEWRHYHPWAGPNRQQFLCGCLESLAKNLATVDGRLIIRQGGAIGQLERLIRETGAKSLYFNRDPDPFGKGVERELEDLCRTLGVTCHGHDDVSLHPPGEVLTQGGGPYRVYTPFAKNWLGLPKPRSLQKPGALRTPPEIPSLPLPDLSHWSLEASGAILPAPGERSARERLKTATGGKIHEYGRFRDFPAAEGTSRISQDLRFGLVSIRTVYSEVEKARLAADATGRSNIEIFIKELAWREFYFAILHHFPNVLNEEFNPEWRGLPWDEPGERFERWKQGQTGFPIVDAGIRQLLATGFMHNRLRMITAMFLTKDLHLDWKPGESWFMQNLVDGEIASNNGGWQWSAGTGADAAPYFRIQNPWSQTARYDPEGVYIKRWVPELRDVPAVRFLQPPTDGRPLAAGYPLPCVDHKTERERTLSIFKRHAQGRI